MRAFSQSRCTVRSESSSIAAISRNEKPQKNFRSTIRASRSSTVGQLVERVADARQLVGVGGDVDVGAERGDLELAAALLRLAAARVVDDDAAHHAGRIAHEPVAVGKRRALAAGNVQIGVVQQRRRAERDAGAAARELAPRHAMQLVVQRREHRVGSGAIALLRGCEQAGDVGRHAILAIE